MEMGGIMGGLYRVAEWIMRLSMTNLLWIICASPFILFASGLLFVENTNSFYSVMFVLAVTAPFILFPATSAMWGMARKWVIGPEDAPILRTFFAGYKENYKQSMVGGIFYSLIFFILSVNLRFYAAQDNYLQLFSLLFIVFLAVTIISLFHFFSILAHLQMSTLQVLKNALLVTMGRPFTSILITVSNGFIVYMSFMKFTFLIPFFMGSLIAMISFWHFNRVLIKVQLLQEKRKEQEQAENEENAENAEDNAENTVELSNNARAQSGSEQDMTEAENATDDPQTSERK